MATTFELIQGTTLGSSQASVTFNTGLSGYTDLVIKVSARDDTGGVANSNLISFNGSTSSFTGLYLQGNGTATPISNTLARFVGNNTSAGATSSTFANVEIYIPNYAGSSYKSFSVDAVTENNSSTAYANLIAGLWSNTAAITSITLAPSSGSYVTNSTFYLYGVKNA